MHRLNDPGQMTLFDPWAQRIPARLYERLRQGWQGLFHDVLLKLMPARDLAEHFHEALGRPTKELYSVAGLLFLKAFNDWTDEEAVEAYCFRLDVQYALNIPAGQAEISLRSLERYLSLFGDLGLAARVFDDVTAALVGHLELDLSQQRLDSTHVYSNMAMLGRTALMAQAVQRLLTQVLRHHRERYEALPEDLRARYGKKSPSSPFGWPKKTNAEKRRHLRQEVAEDMYFVLNFYDGEDAITGKDTYKQLLRVFEEHCEVLEEAVALRPKSGSRALQSLTDQDATYDGHKGRGHQAQISETCTPGNEVQLITDILPQTAADSDSEALPEVVKRLEDKERKPDSLLADTAYGSDENQRHCAGKGVELITPVQKRQEGNEDALTPLDFERDPATGHVTRCPAGHKPTHTGYSEKRDQYYALFPRATCQACPHHERCLACKYQRKHYRLQYTGKSLRLEERRRLQEQPHFKERYRKRAGVEGLMSALKRGYGFGHLRVRGGPAVSTALYLKAAGYNLRQAARCVRQRLKRSPQAAPSPKNAPFGQFLAPLGLNKASRRAHRRPESNPTRHQLTQLTRPSAYLTGPELLLAG